ncbi:hypothetical protein AK830_g53 [Neonectria ditissima]|uniref:Uncharacterized protein n=1 Tax=Neonectria ditissima TaxID=78410 RepID=A0A0P7BYS3_9HYPO|nr:hypothetical protein AK830_g53 [Neonectria ditissima]
MIVKDILFVICIYALYTAVTSVTSCLSNVFATPLLPLRAAMTRPDTTEAPGVSGPLRKICRLHSRMFASNPTVEPETFFARLDLNHTAEPFIPDNEWLGHSGSSLRNEACDAILLGWAAQKKHFVAPGQSDVVGDEERQLDAVASALLDMEVARVYMINVLPKIDKVRGDKRYRALRELCGDSWVLEDDVI